MTLATGLALLAYVHLMGGFDKTQPVRGLLACWSVAAAYVWGSALAVAGLISLILKGS